MYKNNRILATICARGGSKGVKNKNIRMLAGKPIICYSLDLVKQSKLVDEYIISTDSEPIMDVVKNYGFKIHFKRPDELSGDKIGRVDVIKHATQWAESNFKQKFDIIVDLGVASPLKNLEDLENAIKVLVDKDASNVFTVYPSDRNPYFNMIEDRKGKVSVVKEPEHEIMSRQDAPKVYSMNDAFNVFKHDILFTENPQFNEKTQFSVMPLERSIDIDEEFDILNAEFILTKQIRNKALLKDKVIIVAGGLGRIGKAFSEAVLENEGIVIIADINDEAGTKQLSLLKQRFNPDNMEYIHLDTASKDSIQEMITKVIGRYHKIDGFVNTTYPRTDRFGTKFEEVTYKDFCDFTDIHLGSFFLAAQQLGLYFKKQGFGSLINISSIQGVNAPKFDTYDGISVNGNPMTCEAEYCAVKAGIIQMTRYLAKYFKDTNVRFNCISPGGILEKQPEEFLKRYKHYCLAKGMLDAQDLKGAFIFLISDMSKYVNGQNIIVDDGWTL